mmetsp:Transcript_22486/g.62416  ORF Transcript_22486/g.62416 Transcript_22486/m.62416 type:complete len:371 (+) Transcript_22486:254-1366(+)
MVLGDALARAIGIVLLDLRKSGQCSLVLKSTYHGLCDRLAPQRGPKAHLHNQLLTKIHVLYEPLVEIVGIGCFKLPLIMQAFGQKTPLIGELRDHEGQVGVHSVASRWIRHVADTRLALWALVHCIFRQLSRPQKVSRGDHNLVIRGDDLGERRHAPGIEVGARERIRVGLEVRATCWPTRPLDPLQRLEEEGQPLGSHLREAREVERPHLLVQSGRELLPVLGEAGRLHEAAVALRADVRLPEEVPRHGQPHLLPPRPERALEEIGLPPGLRPQVHRDGSVLEVVQVPVVPHDAPKDRREGIEDKVDVHHAAQENKEPCEGDAADASHAAEAQPVVALRARAHLLGQPGYRTEDVEAARRAPTQALQRG